MPHLKGGALFVLPNNCYASFQLLHKYKNGLRSYPLGRLKAKGLKQEGKTLRYLPFNLKPFYTPDPDNAGVGNKV